MRTQHKNKKGIIANLGASKKSQDFSPLLKGIRRLFLLRCEKGTALIMALLMLVLTTAMGIAATHTSIVEGWISANYRLSKQAFYVADAGIERAKVVLNSDVNRGNWDNLTAPESTSTLLNNAPLANIGRYTVTIRGLGGGVGRIASEGRTTMGNATATVSALVRLGQFNPGNAIITGGDLTISGSPDVLGAMGSVHSNRNLTISGNPTIHGNATATGTATGTYQRQQGGQSIAAVGGQPAEAIPAVNPAVFRPHADFILSNVGNVGNVGIVRDRNDNIIVDGWKGGKWNGWKFSVSDNTWSLSDKETINGTFYIEGNAKISGNPGTAEKPWIASIIATGDIEVSGNVRVRPPNINDGALFRSGTENLLFIAGEDIKISGNPQQSMDGIIAAHEQIQISGNPGLRGFIIAEGAENRSDRVTKNKISGSVTITHTGGIGNPFRGDVEITTRSAW